MKRGRHVNAATGGLRRSPHVGPRNARRNVMMMMGVATMKVAMPTMRMMAMMRAVPMRREGGGGVRRSEA